MSAVLTFTSSVGFSVVAAASAISSDLPSKLTARVSCKKLASTNVNKPNRQHRYSASRKSAASGQLEEHQVSVQVFSRDRLSVLSRCPHP
jgi:hypothetical protein